MKTPAGAIPPYTEEGLKSLIGKKCAVRKKSGQGRWWVTIEEVRYWWPKAAVVRVASEGHMFGYARDVALKDVMWK